VKLLDIEAVIGFRFALLMNDSVKIIELVHFPANYNEVEDSFAILAQMPNNAKSLS